MRRALLMRLALGLALTPLAATATERPAVGVAEFGNAAGHLSWWYQGAGRDLAATLSDELTASGALSVMSRLEVTEAQKANSDPTDAEEVSQINLDQRYLVRPVVSFFRESRSSRSSRLRFKGVNMHGRRHSAEIAVDLEIVDMASGRSVYRGVIDSRSASMNLNVGYYQPELSGELSRYQGRPAGKAIAKMVTKLSREIECHLAVGAKCER